MGVPRIKMYLQKNWINVLSYAVLFGLIGALLIFRLSTMLPGYSSEEVATYNAAMDVRHWLDNPFNLPYLILVKLLSYVKDDSYIVTRLASAIFGFCSLIVFARLLHFWQDMRTSIIGTLLLGISPWFLHIARFGSPEVLSLGVFVVMAAAFWARQSRSWLPLALTFISMAICLYIPGMVWFIFFGLLWQGKNILAVLRSSVWAIIGAIVAFLLIVAPLGYAFWNHTSLLLPYLGLPTHTPDLVETARKVALFPYHLLVHAAPNPVLWLGKAPLLDAFSMAMFFLGGYLYGRQYKLGRTPVFLSVILITLILSALGNYVSLNIILPFVYVLIAVGVSYLLDSWFIVFPLNPIARTLGWILMLAILGIVCLYSLNHYFVGWPSARETYDAYSLFHKP